jgi:hypothetical protein
MPDPPPPPQPAPPSEAETAVRALRASRWANAIALCALVVTGMSALFTCQQAGEARRANDLLQKTKASNVLIEAGSARADGLFTYVVVNRNKELVTDVYFTYEVAGVRAENPVAIGRVPGCSQVALSPPDGVALRPGFRPLGLHFRDSDGGSWQRDAVTNELSRVDDNLLTGSKPDSLGAVERITEC